MKYFSLLMIVSVLAGFTQTPKKVTEWSSPRTTKPDSISSPDSLHTLSSTYPFSKAVRIELFSYPDRMEWDQNKKHESSILQNGKMDVKLKKIKERKKLSSSEQTELFNILYKSTCDQKAPMRCYAPRHALVFYDSSQKAFAFIEICLACRTAKVSEGISVDIGCRTRIMELNAFFERVGIKYGLNGKDE